jgi:hypothetical protein
MRTRSEIIESLFEHSKKCNLEAIHYRLIEEAVYSNEWDFMVDYDGCTAVAELHYDYYVFDCFVHDFHWKTGRGGKVADKIFLEMMLRRGLGWYVAYKRYYGVRLTWNLKYKRKHKKYGNVKELTEYMKIFKAIRKIK